MKIKVTQNLTVACSDLVIRDCKPGDVVSVFHQNGRRLLYRRMAMWLGSEASDPKWDPPQFMKMVIPQQDKMHRGAMNK